MDSSAFSGWTPLVPFFWASLVVIPLAFGGCCGWAGWRLGHDSGVRDGDLLGATSQRLYDEKLVGCHVKCAAAIRQQKWREASGHLECRPGEVIDPLGHTEAR